MWHLSLELIPPAYAYISSLRSVVFNELPTSVAFDAHLDQEKLENSEFDVQEDGQKSLLSVQFQEVPDLVLLLMRIYDC